MSRSHFRRLAKPARDFLAGLTLFLIFALSGAADRPTSASGWIAGPAHAHIVPAEFEVDLRLEPFLVRQVASDPAVDRRQQAMALISLAIAFSTVFAFNLWLARHIRRAHAHYRRRSVQERGGSSSR